MRARWCLVACLAACQDGTPRAQHVAPAIAPADAAVAAKVETAKLDHVHLRILDVRGATHEIGPGTKPSVFAFLGPDCPVSRDSLTELARVADKLGDRVAFYGVISDRTVTRARAKQAVETYGIPYPVLFDASGDLAARFAPKVTPEVFVVAPSGAVLYRGRIDDTYARIGQRRAQVTSRDLERAADHALAGVATSATEAVGCFFESYRGALADEKLTWARDVAPILDGYCADCHHKGGVAPFALVSFDDAASHARTIALAVEKRYMPPYHAVPGAIPIADERWLSDRQIEILTRWAEAPAKGDLADAPPARTFPPRDRWRLGPPDLILTMRTPYEVPPSGDDIYRNFVIGTIPRDAEVVAFDVMPGVPEIVHHASLNHDTSGTARSLDARDGFEGRMELGNKVSRLRVWSAGVVPRRLPPGLGQPVKAGADVVLEVHYRPDGLRRFDRTAVGLYFAKEPVTRFVSQTSIGTPMIDIPAGAKRHEVTASEELRAAGELIALRPHMHRLATGAVVTASFPGGDRRELLRIANWDYQWQPFYVLATPLALPEQTQISITCVYDNSTDNPLNPSSPPRRVRFGWGVDEEMCSIHTEMSFASRADLARWITPHKTGD
jgi:thiol-disulfide isomerase/thioredoxin